MCGEGLNVFYPGPDQEIAVHGAQAWRNPEAPSRGNVKAVCKPVCSQGRRRPPQEAGHCQPPAPHPHPLPRLWRKRVAGGGPAAAEPGSRAAWKT